MKYEPMLAEKGRLNILGNNEYIFEPKLDGTRCVIEKQGRRVLMYNRLAQDISYLYPLIRKQIESYTQDFIIDGELICYNERGTPDYRLLLRLEQAMNKADIDMRANAIPATYVAFDILELDGKDLTKKPLDERKKQLMQLIKETQHVERIMFTEQGSELWDLIRKNDMEGVMAKLKGSTYQPGKRSTDWLKLKNSKSVDAVILGYTEGKGRMKDAFTSLILGLYKNDKLIKIGRVETGWDDESMHYIRNKMDPLKLKNTDGMQAIKTELVAEVNYLELTKEKELRAATFKKLRAKKPEHCTWKQLEE